MPLTTPGLALLLALRQSPEVPPEPPQTPPLPTSPQDQTPPQADASPRIDPSPAPPQASPAPPQAAAAPLPAPAAEAPPLTPEERAALRRAARRELLLDPQEVLQNQWPAAPYCNLDPKGKDACLTLDSELFTGFRRSALAGGRKFSEFALDRAELGTQLWWRPHWRLDTGAATRIEAVRSAGPQSLIGIDGNSLIMRLAQAYGHAAAHVGPISIGLRGGLVPERWLEQVEKAYDTRGVDPLASDRALMFDRADLGATLTLSGWNSRVELDASFTNGEGRAQQELNRGKNTTLILSVRPLRRRLDKGPLALALHGLYRDGSYGLAPDGAAGRNHRIAAALTFQSPWAFAGAEYVRALGYNARPDLVGDTLGAWASAYLFRNYLGIMASYAHIRQDVATAGTQVNIVTAGLFGDAFGYLLRNRRRLRLHAGYQYEGYGAAAGPVPGAPEAATTHRFMLQLTAQGLFRAL